MDFIKELGYNSAGWIPALTVRNNRNDVSYSSIKQLELDLECTQYEDVVTEVFD